MRSSAFTAVLFGLLIAPIVSWAQSDSIKSTLGHPDMIIHNAKIVTMDDASFNSSPGTIVQAMAIRGDKILAL